MSAASVSTSKTGAAGRLSFGRIARLTAKELKETLRDRRTILTLVLMPVLVYTVLGLALRQFLLSSFQQAQQQQWIIAIASQDDYTRFSLRLQDGEKLLQEQGSLAVAKSPDGSLILGADLGGGEPPASEIRSQITPDLEQVVRDGVVDLGVRTLPPEAAGQGAEQTFQLVFRANSPLSRQVAAYVERRLRAVNDHDLRQRLKAQGDSGRFKAGWRLKSVGEEQGHSYWLSTLVPLILILMTITGGVYPAIDLTAGERERGTLEALMAAPVPRLALLLAKYVAVVTVSMLTAIVNLTAMTVTIASSGLAAQMFGNQGLTAGAIAIVFGLLALFAAFFSAVLLSITSFARSFKEAQAYVIPVMVVAMAPGFFTVMPGLELNALLSVTPLANIVLLARDVLKGGASPLWGTVAVLSTTLYGALALTMAARIFGSDSILYGSEGSWSDLFRHPRELRSQATFTGALAALALVAPLYVIANGIYVQLQSLPLPAQFAAAAGITALLFLVLPLALARWQGVAIACGFQLQPASPLAWLGAAVLGCSLWTLAFDIIVTAQQLGIATIDAEFLERQQEAAAALVARWRTLSPLAILLTFAVAPAICEELFFRGYLLGALRGRTTMPIAVGASSLIFGLFHACVGGVVQVEHVLGSTFLGLALGWVAWQSRSVLPGMLLHALNNGILLSIAYWKPEIQAWGWDLENQRFLPGPLLGAALLIAALGFVCVWLGRTQARATRETSDNP